MEWQSAPGYKKLPDNLKILFDLYKGLGNRDFENVLKLSTKLLPTGKIPKSPWNDYFLMTAMLSHIALDQKLAAQKIWGRYEDQQNPTIELRLLRENCFH